VVVALPVAAGVGLVAQGAGDGDTAAWGEVGAGGAGQVAPAFHVDPEAVTVVGDGEAEGGDDAGGGVASGGFAFDSADEGDDVHGVGSGGLTRRGSRWRRRGGVAAGRCGWGVRGWLVREGRSVRGRARRGRGGG